MIIYNHKYTFVKSTMVHLLIYLLSAGTFTVGTRSRPSMNNYKTSNMDYTTHKSRNLSSKKSSASNNDNTWSTDCDMYAKIVCKDANGNPCDDINISQSNCGPTRHSLLFRFCNNENSNIRINQEMSNLKIHGADTWEASFPEETVASGTCWKKEWDGFVDTCTDRVWFSFFMRGILGNNGKKCQAYSYKYFRTGLDDSELNGSSGSNGSGSIVAGASMSQSEGSKGSYWFGMIFAFATSLIVLKLSW